MSKQNKPPSPTEEYLATTADDRAAALFEEDFPDDAPAQIPTAGAAGPRPVAPDMSAALPRPAPGKLIPDIQALYKGAEHLQYNSKTGMSGDFIDNTPEPTVVRVKRYNEPPDLYEDIELGLATKGKQGRIPDQIYNLLVYFFLFAFPSKDPDGVVVGWDKVQGQQLINKINMLAQGRGVKPHIMLRQRLWHLLFERKINLAGNGAPQDRTQEDEWLGDNPYQPMTEDNQRLQMLLGPSLYDELAAACQYARCSNKTGLVEGVKYASDAAIL